MRRAAQGFTLIEMMVVVAMIAILMSIAVPGMRGFIAGQQVKSATFELTADLLQVRSEALKRNRPVTLSAIGGDWRAGWTAVVAGQTVLTRAALAGDLAFADMPGELTFNAFGRLEAPGNAVRASVQSTGLPDHVGRCIELDVAGRAASRVGVCS